MARDKQVEYLHQQASALYLQGEYDAALDAWRQLLSLDPKDERAREGARLCELLVKETRGSSTGAHPVQRPPAAAGAGSKPPSGVGYGMGEQLDQELNELDEMLGGAPGRDWMDAKPPAAQPAPSAPLEFDLSAVPPTGAAGDPSEFHFEVEAPDRPAREPGADTAAFDLGEAQAAPSAAADAAGETAAEELLHRTNELMAEALEYYERGEREEALSALTRLTILDEHNEAALNFAAHIRAEMEQQSAPAQPEADRTDDAGDAEFSASRAQAAEHEPFDLGPARPAPAASQAAPRIAPGPADDAGTAEEVWDESGLADELSVASARKGSPLPALEGGGARPRPNKWLIIAAGGLVALGAAYVTLGFLGGSPDEVEPTASAPLASPPPLTENRPAAARPPAAEPPVAPTSVPLSPETRAKIDELMDRADRDFESGNFAAAVLSYNDALKLDPDNEVARKKLQQAGELFHQQKEKLEERATAIESFNEGDYRNALRIFYRIEPVDAAEAERLTRFKAIGWYNLGVRALVAGDCRLARSHLLESQQLDPLDRHLQHAMQMNAACFEGTSQAYYDAVRTLQLRGLDD